MALSNLKQNYWVWVIERVRKFCFTQLLAISWHDYNRRHQMRFTQLTHLGCWTWHVNMMSTRLPHCSLHCMCIGTCHITSRYSQSIVTQTHLLVWFGERNRNNGWHVHHTEGASSVNWNLGHRNIRLLGQTGRKIHLPFPESSVLQSGTSYIPSFPQQWTKLSRVLLTDGIRLGRPQQLLSSTPGTCAVHVHSQNCTQTQHPSQACSS